VEKRPGFDIEAKRLFADLKESLSLSSLTKLRLFNRYDCEGIDEAAFERAKSAVFSEPNQDLITDELPLDRSWAVVAAEYLPGQYDQRADSAAQCIQLLTSGERPIVATARIFAFKGVLTADELAGIKNYLINPVESRPASPELPETLQIPLPYPPDIEPVAGFISMSDDEIAEIHKARGFAMTSADLCFCRNYFTAEGRDPTVAELKVIDTYWSDHCRHTTFNTRLTGVVIADSPLAPAIRAAFADYLAARREVYGEREAQKDISLMDMATIGGKLLKKRGLIPDLDESEEINACSIETTVIIDDKTGCPYREKWLVQFKNETHNHPTEIEPFGGAATCLGGAIRDPLSGRAYVYQAMRVTGSGDPTEPLSATMKGKLPQKKITTEAARGYSSYGNQIGLATGQVTELYDEGYKAKRLEIGAVIGASPKENVVRLTPRPGDVIVLLGGRTGRDGCGGATGSSKAHTSTSIETCGAEVQKGNAPTERKLQRLFRNPKISRMIKRCNDFGAGGVAVAIGELADSLNINLDMVPKKYEGLSGTELAISESQERMAVVLSPDDLAEFIRESGVENLEATPVARVSETGRLVMTWRGKTIVDLSRGFLDTNGVTAEASAAITPPDSDFSPLKAPAELAGLTPAKAFSKNLARLNVCSQKGLSERFDSSIGANTVLMPFGGKTQLTPEEAMCAKLPVLTGETTTATAMSYGFIPQISRLSPFLGAQYAVAECLSRLAAAGANPLTARLTFQEYFERLYDKPERWGKPAAALLGALKAQLALNTPAIGGKDSMSGSFEDMNVPPTLVSFAVAVTDARNTVSAAFKSANHPVFLVPLPVHGDLTPDYGRLREIYKTLYAASKAKKILAASVVKEGGAAACVAKMCFGNQIGFEFNISDADTLFAPLAGSLVLESAGDLKSEISGAVFLGRTTAQKNIIISGEELSLPELIDIWQSPLESVFPQKAAGANEEFREAIPYYVNRQPTTRATEGYPCNKRSTLSGQRSTAKPRVFIPVFPGTNCEYDTARAFSRAGGEPDLLVMRNLTASDVEETALEMERRISQAQMIMLPGGFSAGDEPDGSGKFIAAVFRNPRIRAAVIELIESRDGLMLGICNGFQALVKLGLLPGGEIRELTPDDPTLTFNTIGRHVSQMAYTKINSVKSPWLADCEPGAVYAVPVSHGEGRFVASREQIEQLAQNGQIATVYCTPDGTPAFDVPQNPNGSVCGIEGICSPDGRVFGKMGHSERVSDWCYVNIPGNKFQPIFSSGVKYFS
jgi:phosphoribosylformylglycinamidine synthase